MMAQVLKQCKVIIVGSECPDLVAACKMIPAETMADALRIAAADLGLRTGPDLDVLIVPHALLTLPLIQGEKKAMPE